MPRQQVTAPLSEGTPALSAPMAPSAARSAPRSGRRGALSGRTVAPSGHSLRCSRLTAAPVHLNGSTGNVVARARPAGRRARPGHRYRSSDALHRRAARSAVAAPLHGGPARGVAPGVRTRARAARGDAFVVRPRAAVVSEHALVDRCVALGAAGSAPPPPCVVPWPYGRLVPRSGEMHRRSCDCDSSAQRLP